MSEIQRTLLELDDHLAKIIVNIETLEHIQKKFTNVRQQINVQNEQGTCFRKENNTIIAIIDDLLFYTMNDLRKNYKVTSTLVSDMQKKLSASL